jgi:hypothetical protein
MQNYSEYIVYYHLLLCNYMYLVDENKIHSFTTRAQTNTIRLGALEGSISIPSIIVVIS